MRRILAPILAAVLLAAALPVQAEPLRLSDLTGHWARAQVEAGVAQGYISGYPDGTFRPDSPITRAEFFKLLGSAMRLAPVNARTGFAEEVPVQGNVHWSFGGGAVPAAVSAGLIVPPDYGQRFGPDERITRREILVASVRALGQEPVVYAKERTLNVPDAGRYPEWLRSYAALGLEDGLMTGYDDGALRLERTATRAEAVVIIQRILPRITLKVAPLEAGVDPAAMRHPAAGEPLWTIGGDAAAPVVKGDAYAYTFGSPVTDLALLPAPEQAAYLRYREGSEGVVARLRAGRLTELARYEGALPALLAVDDDGRLWFTAGEAGLQAAGPAGQVARIADVKEPVQFGQVDWDGGFWAIGRSSLYQVSQDGAVTATPLDLDPARPLLGFGLADNGTAWVLLGPDANPDGSVLEAVQFQDGRQHRRVVLMTRYAGGLDSDPALTVLGSAGPFLWLESSQVADGAAGAAGTQVAAGPAALDGLYRFDLNTGEFVRMQAPETIAAGFAVQPAPGSGILLHDGGRYWRVRY